MSFNESKANLKQATDCWQDAHSSNEECKYVLPDVWSDNEDDSTSNPSKTYHYSERNPIHVDSFMTPAVNNWQGDFGFCIIFSQLNSNSTKSSSWTYSPTMDKMFCTMNAAFPIRICTSKQPPEGTIIRAMAVYSSEQYIKEVVKRCLHHSQKSDPTNFDHPAPDHLIRCDHSKSAYMTDSETGRHFVIVPYEPPQEGMMSTTYVFRLMCFGSCTGGINRRPLTIIFSLMHNHCCLGRYVLPARICACPLRDRMKEEKVLLEKHDNLKRAEDLIQESFPKEILSRNHKLKRAGDLTEGRLPKQSKSDSDSDEAEYIIRVKGRATYELLSKLNEALQLVKLLTPGQIQLYQEQKKKDHMSAI